MRRCNCSGRDQDVIVVDDMIASGGSILDTARQLKEMGARKVISRATSGTMEKFLLRNGADAVVFPERQLAWWMAIRYSSDNIVNYFDMTDGYAIYEVNIPRQWDRKKISEIDVRKRYGINILGIRNSTMNMNPPHDSVLYKEDTMLVLGRYEDIHRIFHL